MNILPKVRLQKLTQFNWKIASHLTNSDCYPIQIYVYDRGIKYYITTDMVTTDPQTRLPEFNDPERSVKENMMMSIKLCTLLEDCEKFYKEHPRYSPKSMKKALIDIVQGKALEEVYVEDEEPYKMSVGEYISKIIMPSKSEGTRKVYRHTANLLIQEYPNVSFRDIDENWLIGFKETQKRRDIADSTVSIHLRNIRHAFNTAITDDCSIKYPFRKVKIKFRNKPKRRHLVLTAQQFADFRDYPVEPWQQKHKDIVLLSFYLCGINMSDLCKQKSLYNGRFEFDRTKTGVETDLPVPPEAFEIINKYRGKDHVIDILDNIKHWDSETHMANKCLKKIGYSYKISDKVGKLRKVKYLPMFDNMTVYTMRRTFSTLMAEIDAPTEIINMALSHSEISQYSTTEIYIVRNRKKIDLWTRKLFDYLAGFKGRPKEVIDNEIKQRFGVK